MKFGIFYEISVPRPWGPETERQVYANCIEQCVLADQLGFDHVWAVEHHFLEEYSHCSAPEIFLATVAAKTERIRVGHGINVCVPEINHPIRIAERSAVLDLVSNGRLDVGTGRSATWTELGGFRANPDLTKATWGEIVRALPKMWTQERYAHDGVCFSMPERAVLPKPYQKPHPPMWVAVTSPGTEIDAAEHGIGALGLTFNDFAEQERRVKAYRQVIANCEPVGRRQRAGGDGELSLLPRGQQRRPGDRPAGWSAPSAMRRRNWSRRARSTPLHPTRASACCRRCAALRRRPATLRPRPRGWPWATPSTSPRC